MRWGRESRRVTSGFAASPLYRIDINATRLITDKQTALKISDQIHRAGILGVHGFSLTWATVHRVLTNPKYNGGGRGIRTPVTLAGKAVFKTACFNHSHIPPTIFLF